MIGKAFLWTLAIAIAASVYVNGLRFRWLNRKSEHLTKKYANVSMDISLAALSTRRKMVKCLDYETRTSVKYGNDIPEIAVMIARNKIIREGLMKSIQQEAAFVDNLTDFIQEMNEEEA